VGNPADATVRRVANHTAGLPLPGRRIDNALTQWFELKKE